MLCSSIQLYLLLNNASNAGIYIYQSGFLWILFAAHLSRDGFIWIGFLVWFWSHPLHNQPLFDGSVEGTNSHGVLSPFDYFPQTQCRSNIFHPDMKRFSLVFSMDSGILNTCTCAGTSCCSHHQLVLKGIQELVLPSFPIRTMFSSEPRFTSVNLERKTIVMAAVTKVLRDCDVDSLVSSWRHFWR